MGANPAFAQQNETRIALVIGQCVLIPTRRTLEGPVNNARALTMNSAKRVRGDVARRTLTKEAMRAAFRSLLWPRNARARRRWCSSALMALQSDRQTYVITVNARSGPGRGAARRLQFDSAPGRMNKKGADVKIAISTLRKRNPIERASVPSPAPCTSQCAEGAPS